MSAPIRRLAALPLLIALLAPPAAAQREPDLLVLRNGERIDCRVLLEGEEHVVYRAGSRTRAAGSSEVALVRSVERSLRGFLERLASLDPADAQALYELGLQAETNLLPGEAHNAWLRVLTLVPGHEGAWIKLGGVKRKGVWQLKVRGRFYTLDELRARAAGWDTPLELQTAHFLVRTDAPLERALDAAVDLERAWLSFYDLLARPLDLYVFDEVPEVRVYADAREVPAQRGGDAWFDRGANVLHVALGPGQDPELAAAELADCLLQNAFRRTLGQAGEIEPWARKGLGQAFAAALRPSPGGAALDLGAPSARHFEAQARDKEPLALEQVLRAGSASFGSGPDAARFAAQSYTLVHLLAFSEGGRHRAGLAEFLRRSYLGQGGTSTFFKAVGVDEETLEEEWTAYVRRVARARPGRGSTVSTASAPLRLAIAPLD